MPKAPASDVAFTPAVKAQQSRRGSRAAYARMERQGGFRDRVDSVLEQFLGERESLYLGTASADGRPYIQHRGGPRGFLKVLDDRTLAFADYGGNKQYVSLGNLSENDRAFLFLMDYPNRTRIKIWGRAEVIENNAALLGQVTDSGYRDGRPERVIVFHVEAWDINCQQHIQRRYTAEELQPAIETLRVEIEELRTENARLRALIPDARPLAG